MCAPFCLFCHFQRLLTHLELVGAIKSVFEFIQFSPALPNCSSETPNVLFIIITHSVFKYFCAAQRVNVKQIYSLISLQKDTLESEL